MKAGRKRESYRLRNRRRVVLMRENLIQEKSKRFAIRIIRLYQHLSQEKREFVFIKAIAAQRDQHWRQCRGGCTGVQPERLSL